jgi:hypothetical protein
MAPIAMEIVFVWGVEIREREKVIPKGVVKPVARKFQMALSFPLPRDELFHHGAGHGVGVLLQRMFHRVG